METCETRKTAAELRHRINPDIEDKLLQTVMHFYKQTMNAWLDV